MVHELLKEGPSELSPNQHHLERTVLGTMLRWPQDALEELPNLSEGDFTSDLHRAILEAILHVSGAGKQLEMATVGEWILAHRRNVLMVDSTLTFNHLLAVFDSAGAGANLAHYTQRLRDLSCLRQLHDLSISLLDESGKSFADAQKLISHYEREIYRIAEHRDRAIDAPAVATDLPALLARIDDYQDGRASPGITTGIRGLDDILLGLPPGSFVVVGARPSTGKTALAIQIARYASLVLQQGVFFASLEQERMEINERILAALAQVDGRNMRIRNGLTARDAEAILKARNVMADMPLYIDDKAGQTVERIASTARKKKRQDRIGLVIVDYLQLIRHSNDRLSRHDRVSDISNQLKGLAKDLQVPVIALAQLNREVENRTSNRPQLSDLRSSGEIEQDADVIILMHRVKEGGDYTDLIVGKHRNGQIGEVRTKFDSARMTFTDILDIPHFPDHHAMKD